MREPSEAPPQMDLFSAVRRGPRVLSVTELTAEIRQLLEGRLSHVWVAGEISNFRRQSSGHCYFALKDDGAQLPAVMFRGQARHLRFSPRDGLEVLARGRIGVYEPRGQYQLIVDQLEPRGLGALQAAFEELKDKLRQEGLFEPARKRAVPYLPRRVGVVTSPTGAAVRDFLRVLHRRNPGISVLIAPARVQGEGAAREIARQLRRLDARGDLDAIVITRGGGSIEDLWAFNEELVARAVAACETPVVSAVGHEVDFTIADFVADRRCPTPSAAAEQLAPELKVLRREVRQAGERLQSAAERTLENRRSRLEREWGRVADPRHLLGRHRLRLEELRGRLEGGLSVRLKRDERTLRALADRLSRQHPTEKLHRHRNGLDRMGMRLSAAVERLLGQARQEQGRLAGTLDALSPLKVLDRGYGLVRTPEGRVVRSARDLARGDRIHVDLARGRIAAEVREVNPGPAPGEED